MKINNNNKIKDTGQYAIVPLSHLKLLHGLSGADVLVYLALLAHRNKDTDLAYPSAATIQKHTTLSRSAVMRSMKRLKDDGHIIKTDFKYRGVIAYSFDTCTNLDTCTSLDTCTNLDTPTCTNLDTPTCTNLDTQTVKGTDKETNTVLASTDDEILFLLLWEKWNNHNLCMWSADNEPLSEYRMMKNEVIAHLQQNNISKDWCLELQVIDIFIMQQLLKYSNGKEYTGHARLWSGIRVWSGLSKWLSSDTPSYINASKARFKPHMITLQDTHQQRTHEVSIAGTERHDKGLLSSADNNEDVKHFTRTIKDIYEAFEIHEDQKTLEDALSWINEDMNKVLTAEQIETVKQNTTGTKQ